MEVITVIVPTRNEEGYVVACIDSILAFEMPADCRMEVLVMDGQSEDRTRELVQSKYGADARVRLIDNPGRIQSCAMNNGIERSEGGWILRLDAHTHYPRNYLRLCHETAKRTGAANVGGICITHPGGDTYQARLVQALTTHKFGVGDSGFRTGAAEGPADTVPFGFFARDLFRHIGLFDERLVRAQDYEFNRRIIASGRTVWLNPAIQSEYYNQARLAKFYRKQVVLEAPYNAYMWYLAPYAFAPRHAVTGVFALGMLGGLALSPLTPWIAWPFAGVMGLYVVLAILSALQQAVRFRQPVHALTLPFCFFGFHFLHGLGVLAGLIKLATGTAPVQKVPEPWPNAGFSRVPIPLDSHSNIVQKDSA